MTPTMPDPTDWPAIRSRTSWRATILEGKARLAKRNSDAARYTEEAADLRAALSRADRVEGLARALEEIASENFEGPPGISIYAAAANELTRRQKIARSAVTQRRTKPMTNIYESPADGRQSKDTAEKVSRFRPRYRALTDDEKALHDAIKAKASELETLFEQVKPGRYLSLGMMALEQSVMWAVKELTS